MLSLILNYYRHRRTLRAMTADFYRGGMHCDLVPVRRDRWR